MADSVAPSSGDIYLYDIGDNNNTSDIRLRFYEPSSITSNNSYKIFIVATSNIDSVDYTLLSSASCIIAPPIGPNSEHVYTLPLSLVDVNGNSIVAGVQYQAIIQAVTLSGVSNYVISTETIALAPETVHIAINGLVDITFYVNEGTYNELGAIASDSSYVTITGYVDSTQVGVYYKYYNATGANETIRTIHVIRRPKDFDYGFLLGLQLDGGSIYLNGDYGIGDTIDSANLELILSGIYAGNYTIIS